MRLLPFGCYLKQKPFHDASLLKEKSCKIGPNPTETAPSSRGLIEANETDPLPIISINRQLPGTPRQRERV